MFSLDLPFAFRYELGCFGICRYTSIINGNMNIWLLDMAVIFFIPLIQISFVIKTLCKSQVIDVLSFNNHLIVFPVVFKRYPPLLVRFLFAFESYLMLLYKYKYSIYVRDFWNLLDNSVRIL